MSPADWRRRDRPIGYGRQNIDDRDVEAVAAALRSDYLTQGPLAGRFEEDLRRATGSPHAVVVSSGTAALQTALACLDVGPGSRVVTSANTFLASATTALHLGADVDFVDVERETGNLDPVRLAELCERGPKVDVLVAVHYAGRACDLEALLDLRERHGFRLVVDGCHALGGTARVGGRSLRLGEVPGVDATALSFHPVKHITTGEGGACLFAEGDVAQRARRLREHGVDRDSANRPFADSTSTPPWFAPLVELGYNFRLGEPAAALGRSQLARLDELVAARRRLAARYDAELLGCDKPAPDEGHAWHLYPVHVAPEGRDELMAYLAEGGIGTQVHYYPVPLQPLFAGRWSEGDFPRAVAHARGTLSLPLHPGLADTDQDRVIAAFAEWA